MIMIKRNIHLTQYFTLVIDLLVTKRKKATKFNKKKNETRHH